MYENGVNVREEYKEKIKEGKERKNEGKESIIR
jgi:hypothetical protein